MKTTGTRPWSMVIAALFAAAILAIPSTVLGDHPGETGAGTKDSAGAQGQPDAPDQGKDPVVLMSTSLGDIKIRLFKDKAPVTVKNFLSYVESGFYKGTLFHRVIPGFVIQGGGLTANMSRKETMSPIKNEADNGLKNLRGTLSMARTAQVNSATSQFFINVVDNARLDHRGTAPQLFGYAVFAEVIEGMDVVDKIRDVKTTTRGQYGDVPVTPVVITNVKLME